MNCTRWWPSARCWARNLQRILDEKTTAWGITVQSVEIRDVQIPQALQDAMSREAQAERERRARIILGIAETEIAEMFGKAALTYQDNPVALHLRAMNMLYEAIKEKGSMVIVPSSAVETMGLGGMLATTSLAGRSRSRRLLYTKKEPRRKRSERPAGFGEKATYLLFCLLTSSRGPA